jgi:peptidoglycan/LPS O-acetylase OafA/YrhL
VKYRRDIDGLRALAVLPVVLFHAKVPGFSGGFVGVDVFFVISGYLITGLIAADWRENRFSFVTFYFRRAKRILPALFCVYLACTVLAALIMLPSDMAEFGRSLVSSAAFVSNHFFFRLADYFGGQSDLKPLLHTWSLSIEEQFYVVWPVVFLIMARWRPTQLPYVVWTIGAISFAAAAIIVGQHKEAAFFLAPFRAWELLLGAALALLAWRPSLPAWGTEALAGTGLALIVASVVLLDESQPFPGLLALPACLGTALLILVGMANRPLVTRMLSLRLPVAIGLVSYSLYLWHWPLLALARYHYDRPLQWAEVAGLLGASLLLAVLTYRYVETPARHLSINLAPRVVGAGVLSLAAIALAGHQINKSRGWTFSLDPEIRQLDRTSRERNPYRNNCSGAANVFRADEACTFGVPRSAASYDMAIFGDSHADHYTPAMSVLAEKAGMSGRQITVGRCLMLVGYHEMTGTPAMQSACRALREAMLRFVEENPALQVAVLAQHWSSYTGKAIWQDVERIYLLGGNNDTASEQRTREVLQHSLDATLDYFEQRGVHVILLGEVPLFDRDPIRCIVAALRQGKPAQSCRIAASDVQRRVGEANALLADLAARRGNVSFYSPLEAMCDKEWCSPTVDGIYMYRDRMHLNRIGAEHLARSMPDLRQPPTRRVRVPQHTGSTGDVPAGARP